VSNAAGGKAAVVKKHSQLIHTNLASAGRENVFSTKNDGGGNPV
jgi:hypothetical protein